MQIEIEIEEEDYYEDSRGIPCGRLIFALQPKGGSTTLDLDDDAICADAAAKLGYPVYRPVYAEEFGEANPGDGDHRLTLSIEFSRMGDQEYPGDVCAPGESGIAGTRGPQYQGEGQMRQRVWLDPLPDGGADIVNDDCRNQARGEK